MRDEMSQTEARIIAQKQAEERAYLANMNKQRMSVNDANTLNECAVEPCRVTARAALEQRRENLLREANGISALLQALPGSMGHVAEEALWKIVVSGR